MASSAQPGALLPPQSSTASDDGNQQYSLAPKNRACPFCNQFFTSSSLGRHLDLYIKERNPKAPDGIHDVEQIRKLRSQITRRHARSSTGKKQGSEVARSASPTSDAGDSDPKPASPYVSRNVQPPPQAASLPMPQFTQSGFPHPPAPSQNGALDFHKLKWQATGVINDIPPRTADSPRIDLYRDPDQRQKLLEERDHGRAAELALRHILSQIQAAEIRLHNTPLFPEYDFFACNLPALCFKLLSPPPTLFSTTPVPTPDTWPIDTPPDQITYKAIRDALVIKIDDYHRTHNLGSPDSTAPSTDVMTPEETNRFLEHLDLVWTQWSRLSHERQAENWSLELLRVAADERQQRITTAASLEQALAEIETLRVQLHDQAAAFAADSNRPGSERNLWKTVARPSGHSPMGSVSSGPASYVSNSLARALGKGLDGAADAASRWDFQTLVGRWRETLRNGPLPQIFTSPPAPHSTAPTPASTGLSIDANGGHTPGGAHQREQTRPGQDLGPLPSVSKRTIADIGVADHHLPGRPAPALREHHSSSNGSPVKRDGG